MKLTRLAFGIVSALAFFPLASSADTGCYGDYCMNDTINNYYDFYTHFPGSVVYVWVCNVNGPDDFMSVRSGPGTQYPTSGELERFANVTINSDERVGRWVRVLSADRNISKDGYDQKHVDLRVAGWAHQNFLCDQRHPNNEVIVN